MLDSLKGELKIFVHVKGKGDNKRVNYSSCIGGTKGKDGEWLNFFAPVNFSKKMTEEIDSSLKDGESFDILLKDGWLSAYKDRDDITRPSLFVNKAKIIDK